MYWVFLQEQIGILTGGILLLQAKRLQFAKISPCTPAANIQSGGRMMNSTKVLEQEELVPLQNVISYVPLIHDCVGGKCVRKEIKKTNKKSNNKLWK